jgi:pimeloyl-ACP methyl ester carboxylesterase
MPKLEVIRRRPARARRAAPLLFVHGAYAAAWCWDENFLPFFAEQGFECYALSLRGHGASGGRDALAAASLDDYVADVASVAATLDQAPVVIGHSMGGAVAQRYVHAHGAAGVALLASLPPQGLWSSMLDLWWRDPSLLAQLSLVQSGHQHLASIERLQAALFAPDMPAAQARHYLSRMQIESHRALMDLSWLHLAHRQRIVEVPVLVLGGEEDGLFRPHLVESTARWHDAQAHIVPELGHLLMLDRGWLKAARPILDWIEASIA